MYHASSESPDTPSSPPCMPDSSIAVVLGSLASTFSFTAFDKNFPRSSRISFVFTRSVERRTGPSSTALCRLRDGLGLEPGLDLGLVLLLALVLELELELELGLGLGVGPGHPAADIRTAPPRI
jgi:hypothetical protein